MRTHKMVVFIATLAVSVSFLCGCSEKTITLTTEQLSYLETAKTLLKNTQSYTAEGTIEVNIKVHGQNSSNKYFVKVQVDLTKESGVAMFEMKKEVSPYINEEQAHMTAYAMGSNTYYSTDMNIWNNEEYDETDISKEETINIINYPGMIVSLLEFPYNFDQYTYAPDTLLNFIDYSGQTSVLREDEDTIEFAMLMGREYYLNSTISERQQVTGRNYEEFSQEEKQLMDKIAYDNSRNTDTWFYPMVRKSDGMLLSLRATSSLNISTPEENAEQLVVIENNFTDYGRTFVKEIPIETINAKP
jgi:hypothetical protein